MAYDDVLADRIRDALAAREGLSERKMFGGLAFMINGNMACGVIGEELMVRLDYEDAERAQAETHVRPMDFTGKPLRGMIYVAAEGVAGDHDLASWAEAGADHAASLPPKKPKPKQG
jgi:TfoX/Sxy family transcriptional regulator of competence genes